MVSELDLKRYGFRVYLRGYSAFTPKLDGSNYLLLGKDPKKNHEEISKFSRRDADAFEKYEAMLDKYSECARLQSLLGELPHLTQQQPPSR